MASWPARCTCDGTTRPVTAGHNLRARDIALLVAINVIWGAAVQGWYTVYGERMARRIPAVPLTWATIGYGSITLLPGALFEFARGATVPLDAAAWFAVGYLAIGCTAVGYLSWFILLRRADSRILGLSMYLQPVVGVAFAAIFLGELVTWRTFAGGLLIVAAVTAASVSPGSMETEAVEPEVEASRKLPV